MLKVFLVLKQKLVFIYLISVNKLRHSPLLQKQPCALQVTHIIWFLNDIFKNMQLQQTTQVKRDQWTKRDLSTKCDIVREVFVSKRAIIPGEHADKLKNNQ